MAYLLKHSNAGDAKASFNPSLSSFSAMNRFCCGAALPTGWSLGSGASPAMGSTDPLAFDSWLFALSAGVLGHGLAAGAGDTPA